MSAETEWKIVSKEGAAIEVRSGRIPEQVQRRISEAIREGHIVRQREIDERRERLFASALLAATLACGAAFVVGVLIAAWGAK